MVSMSVLKYACCSCFVGRPATRNTSWWFITMLLFALSYYLWMEGVFNPMFGAAFSGAILGSVSAITVIIFYIVYPKLRTHTNRILFWRTCCDFGMGVLILYYSFEVMTRDASHPSDHWVSMVEHWQDISRCRGLAMAFQFFTFSSEMWFFCNSWDLKLTLDDPFTSDINNMRSYHIVSWSVAILMSLLISSNHFGFKNAYGLWYVGGEDIDKYPICYLENSKGAFWGNRTYQHVILFYLPIGAIYFYALWVFYHTYQRFSARQGLSSNLDARLHILAANAINVIVFLLYWSVFVIPYVLTYELDDHFNPAVRTFYWIVQFHYPCKGLADLVVFVITNDLSKEHLGSSSLFGNSTEATLPQTNKALRDEVLHFVTSGVRRAAEAAEKCVGSPEQQELDINPLTVNDSGINFTAFKAMLTQMFIGGASSMRRKQRGESFSGSRVSFGAEAVARMHIPERRALFESENERRVADEVMAANEILNEVVDKHRGAHSVGSVGSGGALLKRGSRTSSSMLTRSSSATQAGVSSYTSSTLEVSSHDEDTHERSVGSSNGGRSSSTIRLTTTDYLYDTTPASTSLLPHAAQDLETPPIKASTALNENLLPTIPDRHHSGSESLPSFTNNSNSSSWGAGIGDEANKTTFIDYLPKEFAHIRKHFKIDTKTYVEEWSTAAKVKLNEGGASQAFFFYSGGERFIAKSCTKAEMTLLRKIAVKYQEYLKANPNSLLLRILGAYCLKTYNNEFYFYVMENLFKIEDDSDQNSEPSSGDVTPNTHGSFTEDMNQASSPLPNGKAARRLTIDFASAKRWKGLNASVLQERYDIKGSWVNRNANRPTEGQNITCRYCNQKYKFRKRPVQTLKMRSLGANSLAPSDRESSVQEVLIPAVFDPAGLCPERLDRVHVPNLVLKDNDLNYRLILNRGVADQTTQQLYRDGEFLATQGIMDYSLLIGVHNERHSLDTPPSVQSSSSGLQSSMGRRDATHIEGPTVYYLGIVDILQEWTWGKQVERWFKIIAQGADPDGLSAAPPDRYLERFQRKVRDILGTADAQHSQGDVMLCMSY